MGLRKSELLEGLIAYLLERGPTDLSLRPMAASVHTSARLLIFHFGSKDEMIAEVLAEIQGRLQRSLTALLETLPEERQIAPLRAFWNWAVHPENLPYLRLLYEVQVLAARRPGKLGKQLKHIQLKWLDIVKGALPAGHRTTSLATLMCGVFDGLLIETLATGDIKRTEKALDMFIQMARKATAKSGGRRPAN